MLRKCKIEDYKAYINEKIDSTVSILEKENEAKIDKKLLLEATICQLNNEIEAYSNQNMAQKMIFPIELPGALLRVQMYQKAVEILREMLSEQR